MKAIGVGEWVVTPGGLARVVGIGVDGSVTRQYFDPVPGCPSGCLEGDGGSGGTADIQRRADVKPVSRWCAHCGEVSYGLT